MLNSVFYLGAAVLENYLKKYDRGLHTKDYEYHIALHAHAFHEKHLKQEFVIAFEVNDKPHDYQKEMGKISADSLKKIITNHFKENTDVDFVLAPKYDNDDKKIGYPFQLKKYVVGSDPITNAKAVTYINKKASHYSNPHLSLIIVPVNKIDTEEKKGLDINELKNMISICDNSLHAVYFFQHVSGKTFFRAIWLSSRARSL